MREQIENVPEQPVVAVRSERGVLADHCDCACHILGIYGGVSCPIDGSCPPKLDGCHRCGCTDTTCPIGECKITFDLLDFVKGMLAKTQSTGRTTSAGDLGKNGKSHA